MFRGHGFADQSPSHFHGNVFLASSLLGTETFGLASRYVPPVSGLRKPPQMDKDSPLLLGKKFGWLILTRSAVVAI